jgi:hypothetical protein
VEVSDRALRHILYTNAINIITTSKPTPELQEAFKIRLSQLTELGTMAH